MATFARQLSTAATALASDVELLADPSALLTEDATSRPTSATGVAEASGAGAVAPAVAPPTAATATQPRRPSSTDRPSVAAYVSGVTLVLVSAFELGAHPTTFFRLYSFLTVALLVTRFFLYRRAKTVRERREEGAGFGGRWV